MTMSTNNGFALFGQAARALLSGADPATINHKVGDWTDTLASLLDAQQRGGLPAVQRAVAALERSNPDVRTAIESRVIPSANLAPQTGCPDLPTEAARILENLAPCAPWVDEYIKFGNEAAGMCPLPFHEAGALALAGAVIARRLVWVSGIEATYTNLYLMIVAESTLFGKTQALRVLEAVQAAAGLDHLTLPSRITPEKLIEQMTTTVPKVVGDEDRFLLERAHAGQRVMVVDEASSLLDSMKRDYNAGMRDLLIELYNSPNELRHETISRGRVTVQRPNLSLLGTTTPKSIAEHLRSDLLWGSGMWPRFGFIVPDRPPVHVGRADELPIPASVTSGLRRLYGLFATPTAAWGHDSEGGRTVTIGNVQPPSVVKLAPGVKQAHAVYEKAVGFDLVVQGRVPEQLRPSYGRAGTTSMKVAMILAALASQQLPVAVEMRHLARAVQICEQWRANLHNIYGKDTSASERGAQELNLGDRLQEWLGEENPDGATMRQICRKFTKTTKEIKEVLEALQADSAVEQAPAMTDSGRAVMVWKSVTKVQP